MQTLLKKQLGLRVAAVAATLWSVAGWNAGAASVSFPDFSDLSSMQLNGATAVLGNPVGSGSSAVLRLTDDLAQSGSAFLKDSIELSDGSGFQASFSTFFAFRISNPLGSSDGDGQGADGIVFVVQTVANTVGGVAWGRRRSTRC